MTKKSSLKTFLKGENRYSYGCGNNLKGATLLSLAVANANDVVGETNVYIGDDPNTVEKWYTDVLDDGTAITYCITP